MKIKSIYAPVRVPLRVLVTVVAGCTLLQACGGGSHYSSTMPTQSSSSSSAVTLDTPLVLAAAQATSETDEPIAVNDGLVTVAGATDETSDPAAAP